MTGRRLNSPLEIGQRFQDVLDALDEISYPDDLELLVFGALWNAHKMPLPARDIEQAKRDIAEALTLVDELSAAESIRAAVFNLAIELISAREHVVLMPGNAGQGH